MKTGDLVKIRRMYASTHVDHIGLVLHHEPIRNSPVHATCRIELLLLRGGIWELKLYRADIVEVISEAR